MNEESITKKNTQNGRHGHKAVRSFTFKDNVKLCKIFIIFKVLRE